MAAGWGTEQMAIRWKQGLLKFWVVASVFWIAWVWWFNIGHDGPYLVPVEYDPFKSASSPASKPSHAAPTPPNAAEALVVQGPDGKVISFPAGSDVRAVDAAMRSYYAYYLNSSTPVVHASTSARYRLTTPDGAEYEVDAPDEQSAVLALQKYLHAPPSASALTVSHGYGKDPIVHGPWEDYAPLPNASDPPVAGLKDGSPFDPLKRGPFDDLIPSPQLRRLTQAAWALGPPISTLILGYVIGWVVLGFRPSKGVKAAKGLRH